MLFTTHDPNHALRAADRAFLMRGGVRLAEGKVREVLTRARLESLYGTPVETLTDVPGRFKAGARFDAGDPDGNGPGIELKHVEAAGDATNGCCKDEQA